MLAVVVGRQKETMMRIEQESGVQIQMLPPAPGADSEGHWTCRITGRCQEDAAAAANTIQDLIDNSPVRAHIVFSFIRPPGTVVPGGLMFYCWCFFFYLFVCLFVSGTLRRYISELPRPIAVKLSDMIGSV